MHGALFSVFILVLSGITHSMYHIEFPDGNNIKYINNNPKNNLMALNQNAVLST